jgi:hydrogenase maturation factor
VIVSSWPTGQVPRDEAAVERLRTLLAAMVAPYRPQAPETPAVVRTEAFSADPPFFGNGDVGRAAVCGIVNELLAAGGRPPAAR